MDTKRDSNEPLISEPPSLSPVSDGKNLDTTIHKITPQQASSARVNADIVVGATEPQNIHFFALTAKESSDIDSELYLGM